ncbi:alpha/beta fold hydrolase [Abyssisolibacter fermentans]|uniref:alpha/beta fold hydrolase n=1 Tax=Abyssisolibacter fermentans TaxID=1766203 RepID=UPI00082E0B78|nr:alpha/beta hydrolase [Abyssisolibacter fermentans]
MNSKLIDIGTTKLEVYTYGKKGPVVVIETGMGSSFYDWNIIASKLSEKTRVLMYHREGYGNSQLTQEPCTSKRIAENLNLLLEKEKINEPIIIVGHSFGGLCALHFTKLYPAKMAGLVLVDSSPVEIYKIEELKRTLPSIQSKYPTINTLLRFKNYGDLKQHEIVTQVNPKLSPKQLEFTDKIQDKIKEFLTNPNLYRAEASEFENMIDSGKEIEKLNELLNIPMKVLGRDGEIEIANLTNAGILENEAIIFEDLIQKLNRSKTAYSDKGEFILVKGAGHNIHLERPDIVIKAIEELLE